jgi:hypothetical protein
MIGDDVIEYSVLGTAKRSAPDQSDTSEQRIGNSHGLLAPRGLEAGRGIRGMLGRQQMQPGLPTLSGVQHPSTAHTSFMRPGVTLWVETTQSKVA